MVSYGLGGHYEPHHDYFGSMANFDPGNSKVLSLVQQFLLLDNLNVFMLDNLNITALASDWGQSCHPSLFPLHPWRWWRHGVPPPWHIGDNLDQVLTRLVIQVPPVAGDALLWRNLRPDGLGLSASLHSGCPVLRGAKKVRLRQYVDSKTLWIGKRHSLKATFEPCCTKLLEIRWTLSLLTRFTVTGGQSLVLVPWPGSQSALSLS